SEEKLDDLIESLRPARMPPFVSMTLPQDEDARGGNRRTQVEALESYQTPPRGQAMRKPVETTVYHHVRSHQQTMESRNGVGRSKAGDWRRYQRVLLPPIRDLHKLEVYEEHGGYSALRDVLTGGTWDQKSVINEVKESGLRGRG